MWHGIAGHDEVVEQFRRALVRGRLASTFLFVGPSGVGKRTLALKLAETLLCQRRATGKLDPCGRCESCTLFAAGNHPDLMLVTKPADRAEIPVRLIIGPPERRGQEGLCHDLWQKPLPGSRRIAILDDADALNEESANALLKTLEEPPPGAVVILIGSSADRQLPTIRSRAQTIRFRPLAVQLVEQLLVERGLVTDPTEARQLAAHADGSLERALSLRDAEYWSYRGQWLARLVEQPFDSPGSAKNLLAFVDAAGKEPAARRNRARQIIDLSIDFFSEVARVSTSTPPAGDIEVRSAAERLVAIWSGDEETAVRLIERTLDAREHLERYANQATLVECWLDDLASEQLLAGQAH